MKFIIMAAVHILIFCEMAGFKIVPFIATHVKMIFSSTGRRPASYCHGVVSVVCPSVSLAVRPCVRPSINSSFKKLLRNY